MEIDLGFNPFFRLDKEVFLPLLESMNGNPGEISIFPSKLRPMQLFFDNNQCFVIKIFLVHELIDSQFAKVTSSATVN